MESEEACLAALKGLQMIRAKVILKAGRSEESLGEMLFKERPLPGTEFEGKYKILSISDPTPIGKNLTSGEPELGIRIFVAEF